MFVAVPFHGIFDFINLYFILGAHYHRKCPLKILGGAWSGIIRTEVGKAISSQLVSLQLGDPWDPRLFATRSSPAGNTARL